MQQNLLLRDKIFSLMEELFPICRSITGQGLRDSLSIINKYIKTFDNSLELNIHSVASGIQVYDWTIPDEWSINDAYIITPDGKKICDFKKSNLYVLNYSIGIDKDVTFEELKEHLFTRQDLPTAIPYNTSYYKRNWGFNIEYENFKNLKDGIYHVHIDAKHTKGVLNYADIIIPATIDTKEEVLFSTYLCHPSLANNELSGPVVFASLIAYVKSLKTRKYNYRFYIGPETIGAINYIHKNFDILKRNIKAGFVLSCLGYGKQYTLVKSPNEDNITEKVAIHILKDKEIFNNFNFLQNGSDERQYCSPLINLPIVTITRDLFGEYKEYHSSLDNLEFINKNTLFDSYTTICRMIDTLEVNDTYISTKMCEPMFSKYGIYKDSIKDKKRPYHIFLNAFCTGKYDIIDIADIFKIKAYELKDSVDLLKEHNLIKKI